MNEEMIDNYVKQNCKCCLFDSSISYRLILVTFLCIVLVQNGSNNNEIFSVQNGSNNNEIFSLSLFFVAYIENQLTDFKIFSK